MGAGHQTGPLLRHRPPHRPFFKVKCKPAGRAFCVLPVAAQADDLVWGMGRQSTFECANPRNGGLAAGCHMHEVPTVKAVQPLLIMRHAKEGNGEDPVWNFALILFGLAKGSV